MQTFVVDTNVLLPLLKEHDERVTAFLSATRLRTDLEFLITEALHLDLQTDRDTERRRVHQSLISTLQTINAPTEAQRDNIGEEWLQHLFPLSVPGSRTYDHNRRDALHVGLSVSRGADYFVTEDQALLKKSNCSPLGDTQLISFDSMLKVLTESTRAKADNWINYIAGQTAYIRSYRPEDRTRIEAIALELSNVYPGVLKWLSGKLDIADRMARGCDEPEPVRIFLPFIGDAIAGYALYTNRKDGKTAKLGTFYLLEGYRQLSIGYHLLYHLLQQWDAEGVESVHVTFTKELHGRLMPIFDRYGFELVGHVPEAYRPGTSELVARKRFIGQVIYEHDFADFVRSHYISALPADVNEMGGDRFQVHDYLRNATDTIGVRIQSDANDDPQVERMICMCPTPEPDNRIVDGLMLERMLYPLEIRWPDRQPFLIPIREEYAKGFFQFVDKQLALLQPTEDEMKRLLRPDNIFFKAPNSRIKRGDIAIFYVSSPRRHLIGEAVVTEVEVGAPSCLYAKFGAKGVLSMEEVEAYARKGRVLAFRFDFFRRYRRAERMDFKYVKKLVPSFNPITYYAIPYETLDKIREDGERL